MPSIGAMEHRIAACNASLAASGNREHKHMPLNQLEAFQMGVLVTYRQMQRTRLPASSDLSKRLFARAC